ncbi:MAG: HAMP domain-containing histidine kinase [Burkholderiales bacterium]|nr:HAMP domain-containing histidine kinase [Burkholderiales bacterium]
MTVRLRIALTILLTGLASAIGVIVTVAVAFERFDHQSSWVQGNAFLGRVVAMHDDLLEQRERHPEEFTAFLRSLLLYEPDSQLYLLGPDGRVLASTGPKPLPPGFKVALRPVQQAVQAAARGDPRQAAYVMGDDPESMATGAVVAARALQPAEIRPSARAAGYLYLVCRPPGLPRSRLALLAGSFVSPALASVLAVIALATALAVWIIGTVTRPLRSLSDAVAAAAREGFDSAGALAAPEAVPRRDAGRDDEFGRLRRGFQALLATLRQQWDELRRLDRFRRESVSNLSHDLRSPLTATVACLETLEQRWAGPAGRDDERRLLEVALRNTRNAAAMVRALGDLALLDEPTFRLHPMRLDLAEVLDDIALRFAERATRQGVALRVEPQGVALRVEPQGVALRVEPRGAAPPTGPQGTAAPIAEIDVELFERALANLLDNALKFTPAGAAVTLGARRQGERVQVTVADQGAGIPAADLPHLFDRLYQSRQSVAPATSDEGRGLGLAIVKRIAELHRGTVAVRSAPGQGTLVTLDLPAASRARILAAM